MLGQLWHPMQDISLYRVGQVGDQPAGHATTHLIAVLHLEPTDQVIDELWNEGCNPLIHCAYESMQNEQTAIHHLVELIEDVYGQVYKHAEHLIIDGLVADADQTWLQRAAQVVKEDFLLLYV